MPDSKGVRRRKTRRGKFRRPGPGHPASRYSRRRSAPLLSRSSSVGLARALGTPNSVRLGPIPRTTIRSLPLLFPRMKPAMTMSSPVLTKARVLMLASFAERPD